MPCFKDLNTHSAIEFSVSSKKKTKKKHNQCVLGFISMHGHNSLLALNWPAGMTVWKTKASCHHIIISNQHVSCFHINLWLCLRLNACPRSLSHFIKQIANVIAQSGEGETRASQWIAFKYLWFFDLQYCLRHWRTSLRQCKNASGQHRPSSGKSDGWGPVIQMEMHNCDAELTFVVPCMT